MHILRLGWVCFGASLGFTIACSSNDAGSGDTDSATANHCNLTYSGSNDAVLGTEVVTADSKLDADGSSVNALETLGFVFVECTGEGKHPGGGRDAAGFNLRVRPPLLEIEASESTANYENLSFDAQGVIDGKAYDYACGPRVSVGGSTGIVGTFQLKLTSVHKVSDSENEGYIVHGTGHGVCPGIDNGHPKSPGFVTFDVTL